MTKSVPIRFAGEILCVSRVMSKWCTQEIPELKHFREHLCWYRTGRSKRSFTDHIEVKYESL